MTPDRPSTRLVAHRPAEPRHELRSRHPGRRFAHDAAIDSMLAVSLLDQSREALVNGAGPEHDEARFVRQRDGDRSEEAREVLEATRLARRLGRAAAAVANARVMSDVASCSVVRLDV
jgi:hypothetical protein